jgi:hypothetical protein
MKRTDTIKPTIFLLICAIAIPIMVVLSEFDANPVVSLIKLFVGYVLLILVPLGWILYLAYHYDILNKVQNRKSTWKKFLVPVLTIAGGTLGIAIVSKVGYFSNLNEQRFRDILYFFTFVIVVSLIAIAVSFADNQNYYSQLVNLRNMSYLVICLLIYLGPIGLLIFHRRLNIIQLKLSDSEIKTTANIR